jgi:hypothetical protein
MALGNYSILITEKWIKELHFWINTGENKIIRMIVPEHPYRMQPKGRKLTKLYNDISQAPLYKIPDPLLHVKPVT